MYLPSEGHTIVLGTAGSGKTSMAIHRAIELQRNHCSPGQQTLLVTFNKLLAIYMNALLDSGQLPDGLVIENYHKTARGFLKARGKMSQDAIADPSPRNQLIARAVTEVSRQANDPILLRPVGFFSAEFRWIAQFGVRALAEYIKAERVGRKGTRVERSDRPTVWQVSERYRALRTSEGYAYDWDDLSLAVEDELRRYNDDWWFQHVVIDEGQDFSPTMLRGLATAVPSTGSLTMFGDVAQQIYGTRISWNDAGLQTKRKWEFRENYRNSKEIAALAIALAQTRYFQGEPDIVMPSAVRAAGPKPALIRLQDGTAEDDLLIQRTLAFGRTQRVGVLVRTRMEVKALLDRLRRQQGVRCMELHGDRGGWFWEPGIMVGTYQSANGLEFDTVWMPRCEDDRWPDPDRVDEVGDEEACAEDVRLLYVGITRARRGLIISHSRNLAQLLPQDPSLYATN